MSSIINKPKKISGNDRYIMEKSEQKNVVDLIKSLVAEYYSGEFLFEEANDLKSFIQSKIAVTYKQAATSFILTEEKTIAHYAMGVRINKIKELLVYTDLSLEAIASKLNYRSPKIMEEELMKQTGLPATYFREMRKRKERLALRQRLKALN